MATFSLLPPRRLRTAYAYFVQNNYHRVSADIGTNQPQPVISRLGKLWREMSQEERQRYIEMEVRDRARYDQAKMEWVRQHAGRPMGFLNRKRKDPSAPKRPATAYIIFKREMADQLREERPDLTARERDRDIIRRWRELDEQQRAKYKEKAASDRLRYAQEWHRKRVEGLARQEVEQDDFPMVAEGAQPAVQGAQPAAQGAQPAVQGAQPAVQGAQPAAQGAQPAVQGAQPAAQGVQPDGQGQPAAQGAQPAAQGVQPDGQAQPQAPQ